MARGRAAAPNPVVAYVALGANLEDPQAQVIAGFAALDALPQTRLIARSALYRTAPVGYREQPDFINAAAAIETTLSPQALLAALLAIEGTRGRVRTFANAPRTLDLDLLLYGTKIVQEPGLTVPHPRMHERAFVLAPLAEIAPDVVVPGGGRVAELLAATDSRDVKRIAVQPLAT
jgi:2-amino-4-hydroxy-6-hydroxymethyldihydropteridine diphosphokinase